MEIFNIICLSFAFAIAVGLIIAIEVYNKKLNKFLSWLQFQINSNTELMKMSSTNYERGLFTNGSKTAYTNVYDKIKFLING